MCLQDESSFNSEEDAAIDTLLSQLKSRHLPLSQANPVPESSGTMPHTATTPEVKASELGCKSCKRSSSVPSGLGEVGPTPRKRLNLQRSHSMKVGRSHLQSHNTDNQVIKKSHKYRKHKHRAKHKNTESMPPKHSDQTREMSEDAEGLSKDSREINPLFPDICVGTPLTRRKSSEIKKIFHQSPSKKRKLEKWQIDTTVFDPELSCSESEGLPQTQSQILTMNQAFQML